MSWKFSANAAFFGAQRDRFNQYQPDRNLVEKFDLVRQVDGLTGIELKYPFDLEDVGLAKRLLEDSGLELSAVNVDIKKIQFFYYGALSARDPKSRRKAISMLKEGMDIAVELGSGIVTTCPLADGFDYPFQIDYSMAWGNFIESVREVASYRPDIRFCLEFQPQEPYARIMLGNVGKLLYVLEEVGMPNVGANLDIGHSFAAGETPAESAALLASKGRLFYIHTDDNFVDCSDLDMISGSVNFWRWLELIFYLKRMGYDGWLGADLSPKRAFPVDLFSANIRMIKRMTRLIDHIGMDRIAQMIDQETGAPETFDLLTSWMDELSGE